MRAGPPTITLEQAARYLASGAADKGCKRCHGRGTRGVLRIRGERRVIICPCAEAAFPRLAPKPPGRIPLPLAADKGGGRV